MLRVLEIMLFSALCVFPYYALLLHPFKSSLRFSWTATGIMVFCVWALNVLIYVGVALYHLSTVMSYGLIILIGFVFCCVAINDKIGKSVLTFLILIGFFIFVRTVSKYFEWLLFPAMAGEYYHWTHSLCMLPVEAIALWIDYVYSVRIYAKVINKAPETTVWRFLWIIPLIFVLVWGVTLYGGERTDLLVARDIRTVAYLCIVVAGSWLIDYVIALLMMERTSMEELRQKQVIMDLQQQQYDNMNRRVEDARRARHDLRHHLQMAMGYLEENKVDELRAYIMEYQNVLPNDSIQLYCQHFAINALLTYYQQRCNERGVKYSVRATIPPEVPIPQYDLTVVFGNLLENAADAAMEAEILGRDAKLEIVCSFDGSMLMLSVENTVAKQPVQDVNGRFRSTKHSGYGIGIESVQEVVERHHGSLTIQQQGKTFRVLAVLYTS